MPDFDSCAVCDEQAENVTAGDFDGVQLRCPRRGEYKVSGTACSTISQVPQSDKVKLSAWIFDQNSSGEIPLLTDDRIKTIRARPLPGLVERGDRLLLALIKGQSSLEERVNYREPRFIAATCSQNLGELDYIASFLSDQGYMDSPTMGGGRSITPSGHLRAEEISHATTGSTQGFVAMWFSEDLTEAYEMGFEPGISAAGYDPIRVDSVEHIGKIDDEIIAQIRKSRFVVADFTGHRGGVYFEAGFALGLNLPVFWTCRKDAIEELHFDIRQFNCIDWPTPEELAARLHHRIEAVIGEGPRKTLTD